MEKVAHITRLEDFDFKIVFGEELMSQCTDFEIKLMQKMRDRFTLQECKDLYAMKLEYDDPNTDSTLLLHLFRRYCREDSLEEDLDQAEKAMKLALRTKLTLGADYGGEKVTLEELNMIEALKKRFIHDCYGNPDRYLENLDAWFELKDGYAGVQDDSILLRYVRAKHMNLQKAEMALRQTMEFRMKYRPDLLSKSVVAEDGKVPKGFWFGKDKKGRDTIYVYPGRHLPGLTTREETYLYAIWLFEQGMHLTRIHNKFQVNIIYDRTGMSYSNIDLTLYRTLLGLQHHFPEAVHKIYVLHANALYQTVYAAMSPFLDSRTNDKIVFVNKEDLLALYDVDQLLVEHGGTQTLDYNWDGIFPAFDDIVRDRQRRLIYGKYDREDPAQLDPSLLFSKWVRRLSLFQDRLPPQIRALFYAYSQQSLFGDNVDSAPWSFQFQQKTLWQAWEDCKGMDKGSARDRFLALVEDYGYYYYGLSLQALPSGQSPP